MPAATQSLVARGVAPRTASFSAASHPARRKRAPPPGLVKTTSGQAAVEGSQLIASRESLQASSTGMSHSSSTDCTQLGADHLHSTVQLKQVDSTTSKEAASGKWAHAFGKGNSTSSTEEEVSVPMVHQANLRRNCGQMGEIHTNSQVNAVSAAQPLPVVLVLPPKKVGVSAAPAALEALNVATVSSQEESGQNSLLHASPFSGASDTPEHHQASSVLISSDRPAASSLSLSQASSETHSNHLSEARGSFKPQVDFDRVDAVDKSMCSARAAQSIATLAESKGTSKALTHAENIHEECRQTPLPPGSDTQTLAASPAHQHQWQTQQSDRSSIEARLAELHTRLHHLRLRQSPSSGCRPTVQPVRHERLHLPDSCAPKTEDSQDPTTSSTTARLISVDLSVGLQSNNPRRFYKRHSREHDRIVVSFHNEAPSRNDRIAFQAQLLLETHAAPCVSKRPQINAGSQPLHSLLPASRLLDQPTLGVPLASDERLAAKHHAHASGSRNKKEQVAHLAHRFKAMLETLEHATAFKSSSSSVHQ